MATIWSYLSSCPPPSLFSSKALRLSRKVEKPSVMQTTPELHASRRRGGWSARPSQQTGGRIPATYFMFLLHLGMLWAQSMRPPLPVPLLFSRKDMAAATANDKTQQGQAPPTVYCEGSHCKKATGWSEVKVHRLLHCPIFDNAF